MAQVSKFGPLRHLRAEPNEFVLHFKSGQLVQRGPGLAYFFNPLSASIAQLPVEDCEITFVLNERTSDFQDVSIQAAVTYRISDHVRAAGRLNFSISLQTGAWIERPLERLGALWAQKALEPARKLVSATPVVEMVQGGAERVRAALDAALRTDPELTAIGVELVTVQVVRVAPTAELEKAMQTPTREGLQEKADQAVFARRALAVEKERAIKENEMATELELAKRRAELIEQQGANQLREIETAARNERKRQEADLERARLATEANAANVRVAAQGEVDASRLRQEAALAAETARVNLWKETPPHVAMGLAMQVAAGKLDKVNHLNVTPDLLRTALQEFVLPPPAGK